MVSIRKYLDLKRPETLECPPTEEASAALKLSVGLLREIGEHALTDDIPAGDRAEFIDAQQSLCNGPGLSDVPRIENAARLVLSGNVAATKDSARKKAAETHRIVSVLNAALVALTGGSKRSEARLQRIQESLERSALIRDEEGLRRSLAEATRLIREERVSEAEHASRDIASLGAEIVKVRQHIASDPTARMGSRLDAIRHLSNALAPVVAKGTSLYAVAFLVDGLNAIVGRFGTIPMEEVFFQIVREKAEPIEAVSNSFRWSSSCVVAVFESSSDFISVKEEVTILCRTPIHYGLMLGNRTAILRISLSHLLVPVSQSTVDRAADEIDRFSGTEAPRA
jgi:hypothetical protein